jgi:hypothetical protein
MKSRQDSFTDGGAGTQLNSSMADSAGPSDTAASKARRRTELSEEIPLTNLNLASVDSMTRDNIGHVVNQDEPHFASWYVLTDVLHHILRLTGIKTPVVAAPMAGASGGKSRASTSSIIASSRDKVPWLLR